MSTAEKIASLGSTKNAVPSLSLPTYNWRSEGEHGVQHVVGSAQLCCCLLL